MKQLLKATTLPISVSAAAPNGRSNGPLTKAKKGSSESCDTLSVYDGITVKIEYISDGEEEENEPKNGDIASSKELLLG